MSFDMGMAYNERRSMFDACYCCLVLFRTVFVLETLMRKQISVFFAYPGPPCISSPSNLDLRRCHVNCNESPQNDAFNYRPISTLQTT